MFKSVGAASLGSGSLKKGLLQAKALRQLLPWHDSILHPNPGQLEMKIETIESVVLRLVGQRWSEPETSGPISQRGLKQL